MNNYYNVAKHETFSYLEARSSFKCGHGYGMSSFFDYGMSCFTRFSDSAPFVSMLPLQILRNCKSITPFPRFILPRLPFALTYSILSFVARRHPRRFTRGAGLSPQYQRRQLGVGRKIAGVNHDSAQKPDRNPRKV